MDPQSRQTATREEHAAPVRGAHHGARRSSSTTWRPPTRSAPWRIARSHPRSEILTREVIAG